MKSGIEQEQYGWTGAGPSCSHEYLLPTVLARVRSLYPGERASILDLGCGNGYATSRLAELGYSTIGIDVSSDGVALAKASYPHIEFETCSIYDEALPEIVGIEVDCVVTLEVIEHLFYPRKLFEQAYRVLKPGGHLILSTPYHGYVKNLAISLAGGWDAHFDVQGDGRHIKFFSPKTLARMAISAGFKNPTFVNVGRLHWLWKSMVMTVEK